MKKIFLLLLFITGFAQAQIINFPDANFKAKLLSADTSNNVASSGGSYIKIDSNSNGEIEVAEAVIINELNIQGSGIADLTGISNFSSILGLNCSSNVLTSLDVTSLIAMTSLRCYDNSLTSLNVVGLNNLAILECFNNQLTVLNVSGLTSLIALNFNSNQISSINLTGLNALTNLYCETNQITSLDLSNSINLTNLSCRENQITSLDLSSLINLYDLDCTANLLTSLDISNNNQLVYLFCSNNPLLTTLNLTGAINLEILNCDDDPLATLDLTGLINLQELNSSYNQITSLNFAGLLNLVHVNCAGNSIPSLDFSGNPLFTYLDCGNNNFLESINIKNGAVQDNSNPATWSNSPNLTFVCIDENEVSPVQDIITASLLTNVNINGYCTFVPGGNYNLITGNILFDADNNGCDASDLPQPFIKLKMNDGTNDVSAFDNTNGIYNFYTSDGTFTVSPDIENPSYFNFSPIDATVNFPVVDNSISTQNFCMTANGVHPDVEIVIAPIWIARPGFDANYQIVYKNKGNQILSGDVNFTYNDAVLDFVSATVSPDSQSTGSLSWNYSNLRPFENRAIYVTLNLNSPTETPAVNSGDILDFSVAVNPITGDESPADNVSEFHQTVVNSLDPNIKQCVEGSVVSPSEIGSYLHYIIDFENIGTTEAENIVVKDVIDETMFDVKSLQIMNSSDPVEAKVTGNVAEFIFKGIKLPAGGHGNILLKIKTRNDLQVGDIVSNKADIFFDYNFPIETNVANTAFQTLGNNHYAIDQTVSVYPNPSKGTVSVKANGIIKSVQLFDIQGRILETKMINEQQLNMDISNYSNGVYFLKVTTDAGIKTEKLIKE
ncbi:MAG: T9SS type A sorting domain-containing protein [Bacteroidota bacterium]